MIQLAGFTVILSNDGRTRLYFIDVWFLFLLRFKIDLTASKIAPLTEEKKKVGFKTVAKFAVKKYTRWSGGGWAGRPIGVGPIDSPWGQLRSHKFQK